MDSYNNRYNQNNYDNEVYCTCGSCDYCINRNNNYNKVNCNTPCGCNNDMNQCGCTNNCNNDCNCNTSCCKVCGCNPCCCNTNDCNTCAIDPCCCNDSCCKGKNFSVEGSKSKVVCTNMDVIYDTCCAQGTPFVITLTNVTDPDFVVDPMFKSCNYYNTCVVDDTSVFTIEASQVVVRAITSVDPIDPSEILVNGVPVISVTNVGNRYVALIDPTSINSPNCDEKCPGTSSSIVVSGVDNWEISLAIQLCGRVSTPDGSCKFNVTVSTAVGVPIVSTTPVTFAVNDICIPPTDNNQNTNILFDIQACAQIINPVLNIPAPGEAINLSGILLINTNAPIQITQNKPVCFYGYTCD